MTSNPKVSVVVPCYNAAPYVGAALRSVLTQTGFELEVIVVDDGSSDGSADAVLAAFPSVTVVRGANQGAAAARNAGIDRARHEWIAFADADDLWLPGKLRAQWALLEASGGSRFAYSDVHLWPSTDPEPSPEFLSELRDLLGDSSRWRGPSGWVYPQLLVNCEVATPTVLMHRSIFDEVGVFDDKLAIGEDYDLWLRVSRVTPFVRVDAPMALYRIHPSNTTQRAPDRNFREAVILAAIERWGYRSPDGACAAPSDVKRHLARSWVDFAVPHLVAGNVGTAGRAAIRALRADPLQAKAWRLLATTALRSVWSRRPKPA